MSLRNRILISIGALIITTSLSIMYIANKSMYHSNVSHAYSILALNKNTVSMNMKNRLSTLKTYALSTTYNKEHNLKTPSMKLKATEEEDISKLTYVKSYVVSSENKPELIIYPEGSDNKCRTNINVYKDQIIFSRYRPSQKTICIHIPFNIEKKKYLASFNVDVSFFYIRASSIPTLIIAPKRFEIDLMSYQILNFNKGKFQYLLENPEIISEKSGFLKTNDHFILIEEIPGTNLRILSYSGVKFMQSIYSSFLKSSIGIMILILIISILIFFFVINTFLKPIKNLCTASRCFSDGIYDQEIKKSNFKEINELINSFNTMTKKIKEREEELHKLNKNLGKEVDKKTRELLHSAKMASLGTLSSGIAHEFNNILGAVIGHVSLALEEKDPKEMTEALEIALSASERACSIVSRLQDFTKARPEEKTLFDIHSAIKNTIKLIEKDFINSKINIIKDFSNVGTININGSQSEIEQVLLNLLINSKHAMPDGGKIRIRTSLENKMTTISIIDTGHGIDKSLKDRIFEPFFTTKGVVGMGKNFGAKDYDGAGLGLSLSLGIVEKHHGTLRLVSTSKSGTTFEIKIPVE
jgi:signal transduction histidine kinase